MSVSKRLAWYLDSHQVDYEIIAHAHTERALESAQAAQVPSGRMAKCVLLEDERGYVMAIVPASCRLSLHEICSDMGRDLELASENEIGELFTGCELGAIPPVGAAFNIPTAVDQSLMRLPDVYFEAGDHEALLHVSGAAFRSLLTGSSTGHYAHIL